MLTDIAILLAGCRNPGEKGEQTQGLPSVQHPTSRVLRFPSSVCLQSDLWQDRRLPASHAPKLQWRR